MTKLLLVFVPAAGTKAEAVLLQLEALASASSSVVDGPLELDGPVPSTDAERLARTLKIVEHALHGARTREGIARAKAAGRRFGRPPGYSPTICARVASDRSSGASWGMIGHKYGLPRTSARRLVQKGLAARDALRARRRKRGSS